MKDRGDYAGEVGNLLLESNKATEWAAKEVNGHEHVSTSSGREKWVFSKNDAEKN
jgi:hypothetical protein